MKSFLLNAFFLIFFIAELSGAANSNEEDCFTALLTYPLPSLSPTDWQARRVVQQLLSPCLLAKKNGAQAYFSASPELVKSIRERYRYVSEGHYIEPFMMSRDSLKDIVSEHVLKKIDRRGDEKNYTYDLLRYMLSPSYARSHEMTYNILNLILVEAARSEVAFPSVVPMVLEAGSNPYEKLRIRNRTLSAMSVACSRLRQRKHVDLVSKHIRSMLSQTFVEAEVAQSAKIFSEGFSVWKNTLRMNSVREIAYNSLGYEPSDENLQNALKNIILQQKNNDKIKHKIGRIGRSFTPKDYRDNFSVWIDVCNCLGADIVMLRKCVVPFLKKHINDTFEYETNKFLRSKELDDFHKFAAACVATEFLFCVASSLSGGVIYNLHAFRDYGQLVVVGPEDEGEHFINAERYRSKLNSQAHKQVELFSSRDDSEEDLL